MYYYQFVCQDVIVSLFSLLHTVYRDRVTFSCITSKLIIEMNWLIVGITGVTCSGKSSLARSIINELNSKSIQFPQRITIGNVKLLKQDDYFHPKTSVEHTWIPEFNYINREILTALNMSKMIDDLNDIVGPSHQQYNKTKAEDCVLNILVIEGFLIFNCKEIRDMCQIKIDVRISCDECLKRRSTRKYNPPNPPGYFEKIIWPFYLRHLDEYKNLDDLHVMNGELPEEVVLNEVLGLIVNSL